MRLSARRRRQVASEGIDPPRLALVQESCEMPSALAIPGLPLSVLSSPRLTFAVPAQEAGSRYPHGVL